MKFLYLLDEDGIFWKRPVSSFKPLILKKLKLIDETETIIVNITYKLYIEDFCEMAKMWLKTHLSDKTAFQRGSWKWQKRYLFNPGEHAQWNIKQTEHVNWNLFVKVAQLLLQMFKDSPNGSYTVKKR